MNAAVTHCTALVAGPRLSRKGTMFPLEVHSRHYPDLWGKIIHTSEQMQPLEELNFAFIAPVGTVRMLQKLLLLYKAAYVEETKWCRRQSWIQIPVSFGGAAINGVIICIMYAFVLYHTVEIPLLICIDFHELFARASYFIILVLLIVKGINILRTNSSPNHKSMQTIQS